MANSWCREPVSPVIQLASSNRSGSLTEPSPIRDNLPREPGPLSADAHLPVVCVEVPAPLLDLGERLAGHRVSAPPRQGAAHATGVEGQTETPQPLMYSDRAKGRGPVRLEGHRPWFG